ncbi:hypothetical protein BR93DRAFT_664480 [Coniochaeta sp. PMI_546]|nr:hypothetical protein BR93DRAFT_664480 [Coniochaeta sp. PMI_546]
MTRSGWPAASRFGAAESRTKRHNPGLKRNIIIHGSLFRRVSIFCLVYTTSVSHPWCAVAGLLLFWRTRIFIDFTERSYQKRCDDGLSSRS